MSPDATADLLIDGSDSVVRPEGFRPEQYPRTRSYPGADALLREVRAKPPAAGARFAGWQATAYGAERKLLGNHPTRENLEALVHKALILARPRSGAVFEVVLIVDSGEKARAISSYAREAPARVAFDVRGLHDPEPRRVEVTLRRSVLDAADCAVAALPDELDLRRTGRVLIVDVGYLRTKLSIVSEDGCEHQEQLDSLGAADLVRRVLRDGQDHGLVEDEFAVIRALESSRIPETSEGPVASQRLVVAGRAFDVDSALRSARAGLEEELERAVRRLVLGHFRRRAETCRAVACIGGGAALVGAGLSARVRAAGLGLTDVWVTRDASFLLLEGAQRLLAGSQG